MFSVQSPALRDARYARSSGRTDYKVMPFETRATHAPQGERMREKWLKSGINVHAIALT
jgi:hypothetical protein